MESNLPPIALESALDLKQILTTGSLLQINEDYENNTWEDVYSNDNEEQRVEYIGQPVRSLEVLKTEGMLKDVDESGLVKKRVLEDGGGEPLCENCTVSVAYSGFWEGEEQPFDTRKIFKPLSVDLRENGLLPGLQIAIKSMLVGEMSLFLLSYKVMYGEMGIPPRIRPKADCVFFIKLLKSTFTPQEGALDFSEPNTFPRVNKEVQMLYGSGVVLFKVNNYGAAIQLFKRGIFMLHKCRLANEEEQKSQEKLLKKFYLNLAICYNKIKNPFKACTACNELNRLGCLWNNGKALFQNAKALRMIGDFHSAEKRLKRAINLCPGKEDMESELKLLITARESCDQRKLNCSGPNVELLSDSFKHEVDNLIMNFKKNDDLCKLTLPAKLNSAEMDYIKEACIRENLFFNKIQNNYLLDKEAEDEENELLSLHIEEQLKI